VFSIRTRGRHRTNHWKEEHVANTEVIESGHKAQHIVPWIIGLILLALVLTGMILALRGPRAVGVDDGAAPAGNIQEDRRQEEQGRQPRTLRQYALFHAAPEQLPAA
jgi:hypothetical protein